MNIETTINFGGFYESIHSGNIDNMIECEIEHSDLIDFDNVDYRKTELSYVNDYCAKFSSYIFNEYKQNIDFKDIKLWSPLEYNFKTDKIDCTIDLNQANKLNNLFLKDNVFLEYLEERTQSYDGYYSYYTYEDALNDKNEVLIMYLLEYLADQFNSKDVIYGEIEFEIYQLNEAAA
tara:strand:- start:711 stop:1241 length:531 start_codon:yes stop_codon:yes gene_type:complete